MKTKKNYFQLVHTEDSKILAATILLDTPMSRSEKSVHFSSLVALNDKYRFKGENEVIRRASNYIYRLFKLPCFKGNHVRHNAGKGPVTNYGEGGGGGLQNRSGGK